MINLWKADAEYRNNLEWLIVEGLWGPEIPEGASDIIIEQAK
jgi:hypothetical protein